MPDITEDTIRDLATFKGKEPVTTCFLDVDGRRFLRQHQIEQELDSVLRPARVEANGHRPAVTHDLDRIERFVRGGFDRSNTRALAFFACRDPELWQVVPLSVPVRSRVVVNDQPAVGELQAMVEQSGRLGVLLVDRQRARMFVFSLGELVEHQEAIDPLPTRGRHPSPLRAQRPRRLPRRGRRAAPATRHRPGVGGIPTSRLRPPGGERPGRPPTAPARARPPVPARPLLRTGSRRCPRRPTSRCARPRTWSRSASNVSVSGPSSSGSSRRSESVAPPRGW